MLTLVLLFRLGETDCEALDGGFLAQPVNALTSLAYVVAGLWVALSWRRQGLPRTAAAMFGVVLALVGLGSFAFHGPQFSGSRWLHDWAIAAALSFIAIYDVGRWRGWDSRRLVGVYLVTAAVLGVAFGLAPEAGEALIGLTVAAVVIAEIGIYRSGLAPMSRAGKRAAGLAVSALVVGLALNLLGRTGAPWCDPLSLAQGHAAWHLLTALALGAYASVFLSREPAPRSL